MANWLTNFKGGWGGFGLVPYQNAINAGFSPAQIAAALPGSGLSVGYKAEAQLAQDLSRMESQARAADSYASQLNSYQSQLDNYSNQINSLTGQYNNALQQATQWQTTAGEYGKQRDEWMTKAGDWENQFTTKSAEYEAARAEADRYREEAVGRQLAGLRGGSTQAGGGYAARDASLTSGKTAYRPGSDDSMVKVEKNISATDSVLARKGPVVQAIRTASQPRTAASQVANQGGTGSYYAGRFG
jgi:hypothetical protein